MRLFTFLTALFIAFLINASPGFGQEALKVSVTTSRINAAPGDEITYVIKYSNAGLTPASNVIISDYLSSSGLYTYVSSSPSGKVSGNVITWDQTQIQELALLSNGEFQILVTVKAGVPGNGITQASNGYYISASSGILDNYATISSSGITNPVQSNICSTSIEQHCSVHINNASGVIKSATNTMVYYLIQVTNNGNVYDRYNLSSLNFDCDGPGGMGFESLTASFADQNGNPITETDWIAPDQTYYFFLKLTANPGTSPGKWSCHNVIATSFISGITGTGNIQTKTEGSPGIPLVSLSIIDDKDPVEAGEFLTYTIYAFNSNNSSAANNFVVKEVYPPNVTFISSTPSPDPGYNNKWTIGNLDYGLASAKTIQVKVKVNSLNNCNGNITNTVSATYDNYDPTNPPTATVITTIKSYPDLEITKSAESSSFPAQKGGSIIYTIRYKNIGTCDAPNSLIRELFDDVHTNVISAGGGTQSGNQISWDLGLLVPGQEGSLTYTVLIDPESTFNIGTTSITGKSTISTSETESNYNNNTAITSIPVSVLPDMKVEVLPANATIDVGTEYSYTLKVSNIGDVDASDVKIKNLLPDGLTIGTISNGGVIENNSVTWPVIPIFEVGSYVEYQVKVTPTCTFVPSFSAVCAVTSSKIDKDETNNSATVKIAVKDNVSPVLENIPPDITVDCEGIPVVGSPTAKDNCDGVPVVNFLGEATTKGTDPLMPNYYNYKLTRSWEAVDASGNHSLKGTQVITIEDTAPPVAPVLADVNVGQCSDTPVAPTTTDNCKGVITGTTTTAFPITTQGTTVVTWTFDDGNGNVITANQNVIVDDVTAPVADVTNLPEINGECSVTVTAPTATDNCKGKITATTTDPLTYSVQGNYTIHWIYDDGNGNTSTQTQSVVVDDVTPPVTPVLADITIGACSGTPSIPTTLDNCKGVITGTTTTVFPITTQGTTVVTWTFDDGNGNAITANQNVIVDDVTAPVADVTNLPEINGECSVTVTAPTATDNCKGKITATTTDPLTYSVQGNYTIHWIYDNGKGNTSTQTQSVVVDDVTPPVTPVLADITIGACSGTPSIPTTLDNCSGVITGTTTTVFPITTQGTTVVTWTFDDGNGNAITANQNVIVDDVTAPVADVTNLPEINGECSVTVTAPTATDKCKGKIVGTTTDPLTYSTQGVYAIHWVYDNGNGNTSTQTQSVVVDDTTPPVTPVLADITIGECSGTKIIAPTTTDNCSGVITGTTTTVFPISQQGTTIVTWTFDDGNGNVTTANQNVIINNISAPVPDITSLPEITAECSATATAPTATDNCKGKIVGTTTDPLTYSAQGKYTIHWIYDNGNGNTSTQTQSVVVDDVTAPVADVTNLPVINGECSVTVTTPTATDNCKGKITATTTDPLTYSTQGSYIIHWIYDDGNGNTSTQTQSVVVDDITPPVAPVLADITIGACSGTPSIPTTLDNCKGVITGTTTTVFPITQQGTTVLTWTFDDGNGNVITANQNVTIDDITSPVPDMAYLPDAVGECSVTVAAPTATDNCKGKITAITTDPLTYSAQGNYTIHWVYDNGNGNISTQTQSVVVDDVTPPETPILPDVFLGECSGTPPTPTTMDNCAGIVKGTTSILFPKTKQGKHTIIWTFDDGNGNVTTAYQNLILEDVTPPVPDIATLADATGECSITVTAPTATDNCKGKITATTTDPLTYSAQGSYIIHWVYDDGNGNTSTQTQNVLVKDITPPVTPILADVYLGECSGTPPIPTTMDNCAGIVKGTTSILFPKTKQGKHTIIWTFDDGNGNVTTAYQNLILEDVTPPVPDIATLADATGECSVTVTAPTATDNCKGKITATTTDPLTYSAQGSYVIHWVYDDGNGNISTQSQNVNVNAFTPVTPVLTDVNVGQCSGTPTAPSINYNCSGIITGTTTTAFPITTQGTTVVTWTFDDGNGNVITANQNVIVDDITPPVPVMASLPEITTECHVTVISPTATDNCKGKITATTTDPLTYSVQGSYIVHWVYDDGNGNTSTQTQSVLVKDITPPEITGTIASITVDGCSVEEVAPAVNSVAALEAMGLFIHDGCTEDALLTVTSKDVASGEIPVTVTRTYTIKDASNNSTNYVQEIVVADSQKPTIVCPPDLNVTADAGNCKVTNLLLGVPITNDNCSISSVTNDAPSVFELGTTVVTWTVSDKSGNTATCQQNVIVDGSPVAIDDKIDGNENTKITGNVMTNDHGLCDNSVQMHIVSEPQFGSLTAASNGNFEYIPNDKYSGTDRFTYQICDGDGDCSTATVEITVNSVNDLPLSVADTEHLQVDVTLNGNVAANDILSSDGDNLWTLVNQPSNGTINFNPDGTYTYTPHSDFIGNDNFSYELCDSNGDCSTAMVTIIVEDVLIPNQILTPNGDEHNDTFVIKGIEYYPVNKVTIYNRWGNIVYKKNNYQNEWDGYSNVSKVGTKSLPLGTYFYLVDYANNRHKTGFVYLDK